MPVIGIDLGTTYSCVGAWIKGDVEIIPNDQGIRQTPSFVAFTNTERLIGQSAKKQATVDPCNTVFGVKRLIGRQYDDPKLAEDLKLWPFKVVKENSQPKIEVELRGVKKLFTPEEITSMILMKMKESAEAYLETPVTDAVITVPAYFNDAQRQATKDAGRIAGLNVLKLINEPTAVALAYAHQNKSQGERILLIYDLGGGTCEACVINIKDARVEVIATAGDTHLGGVDFDNVIVNYCVDKFERKFKKDIRSNHRAISRLQLAAERAKRTLSFVSMAGIEIDSLHDGIDFCVNITQEKFDELTLDLCRSALAPIRRALTDSGLDEDDIDEVILVGSSTRIAEIQRRLRLIFSDNALNLSMSLSESVAYGATVQAAMLSDEPKSAIPKLLLSDVTPHTLGTIWGLCGLTATFITKNTPIPCQVSMIFSTLKENQLEIDIPVFEGDKTVTVCNNFVGSFSLTGLPPHPLGSLTFEVTFEVDINGILNVTATEIETGESKDVVTNKGRLSNDEIQRMVDEAKTYKREDSAHRIIDGTNLPNYVLTVSQSVEGATDKLSESHKETADEPFPLVGVQSGEPLPMDEFEENEQDIEDCTASILLL